MISRKIAVEELNNKIAFIDEKYADSDKPVKDIIDDCDFMATPGEIAALVGYDSLTQLEQESRFRESANNDIMKIISDLKDDESDMIPFRKITRSKIAEAEKCLTINGVPDDEAANVLSMIGTILLDADFYVNQNQSMNLSIEKM